MHPYLRTITRTTTERCEMHLNAKELRKAFGAPDNATVVVHVPGGGDWSNTDLHITEDNPVFITWVKTETEELN